MVVSRVDQAADAVYRFGDDLPDVDLLHGQVDPSVGDAGDVEQIVEQADHVRDLPVHHVVSA